MTYTIEDIKRLVPEAKVLGTFADGSVLVWFDEKDVLSDDPLFRALITTRRQLEIARSELNTIANQDDIEMVLDPTWAKRIAEHSIDAIAKASE